MHDPLVFECTQTLGPVAVQWEHPFHEAADRSTDPLHGSWFMASRDPTEECFHDLHMLSGAEKMHCTVVILWLLAGSDTISSLSSTS